MHQKLAHVTSLVYLGTEFVKVVQVGEAGWHSKAIGFNTTYFQTFTDFDPFNDFRDSFVKMFIDVW